MRDDLRRCLFWGAVILLSFSPGARGEGLKQEVITLNTFRGLNTDDHALTLKDGFSPDSQNVLTDNISGLEPRQGFTIYASTPADQMWEFPTTSGLRYLVRRSSNVLTADTGSGTFSLNIGTVTSTVQSAGAAYGNLFYITNTVDGLKKWSPTANTFTLSVSTINGNQLVTWKGRLCASGIPGSERVIFMSTYLNGDSWTVPTSPADTDPAQVTVQGSLSEPISALYSSYFDQLMWFTQHAFGGILGNRNSNFTLRTYSDVWGTSYPDSIQNCDGYLRFLGPQNSFYEFDGANIKKISGPHRIDSLMSTLLQGNGNQQTYIIDTAGAFGLGSGTFIDTTTLSGYVQISTAAVFSGTDSTNANFNSGTLSNVAVATNTVFLPTIPNWSYAGCTSNGQVPPGWNSSSISCTCTNAKSEDGDGWSMTDSGAGTVVNYSFTLFSSTGGVLISSTVTPSLGSWKQRSITTTAYNGLPVTLQFSLASATSLKNRYTIILNTNAITWWDQYTVAGSNITHYIDNVQNGTQLSPGTFTSRSFDTALSSPTWVPSSVTSSGDGTFAYQTQTSSTSSGPWDTALTWTSGSFPASGNKRFIRYILTLSTTSTQTQQNQVTVVNLQAMSSTGTYQTQTVPMTGATSWGQFSALDDTDVSTGTILYGLYASTNSSINPNSKATWISSQTITNGQVPTIAVSSYTLATASFTALSYFVTPLDINTFEFRWNVGSVLAVPSAWSNQRLWEFVALSSTFNNIALIYDRNQDWQKYTNITAVCARMYNSNLMIANGTGIYQLESGTSDNGSAIPAYYTTRRLKMNGEGLGTENYANLTGLFFTTSYSAATLNTAYTVNGWTASPFSLGSFQMNSFAGDQSQYVPFLASGAQSVRSVDLKFSVTSTSFWNLINANLYGSAQPRPSP